MPAMPRDAYGLPVTTGAASALEAYDRAVEGLLGWDARVLDLFRRAAAGAQTERWGTPSRR